MRVDIWRHRAKPGHESEIEDGRHGESLAATTGHLSLVKAALRNAILSERRSAPFDFSCFAVPSLICPREAACKTTLRGLATAKTKVLLEPEARVARFRLAITIQLRNRGQWLSAAPVSHSFLPPSSRQL